MIRKGSATPIDDALSPLAQRASDSTPSVRSCLVDVLADWLQHQPDRLALVTVVYYVNIREALIITIFRKCHPHSITAETMESECVRNSFFFFFL